MKSEHTETIQKAFIMQSRHFETHKANFTQKGLFDHVVSEVQPKKTDHILEVAVGTCICGRVFAPFVHEVTCLDVTPAMLAVGKTQAEKQAYNNMMFVTDDAEKLPFLDYSFGKIVNISSMGGKIWTKFGGWYHATKFAVEGFSDCLRMELKPFGLDVVVVEPGGIKTDWAIIGLMHDAAVFIVLSCGKFMCTTKINTFFMK